MTPRLSVCIGRAETYVWKGLRNETLSDRHQRTKEGEGRSQSTTFSTKSGHHLLFLMALGRVGPSQLQHPARSLICRDTKIFSENENVSNSGNSGANNVCDSRCCAVYSSMYTVALLICILIEVMAQRSQLNCASLLVVQTLPYCSCRVLAGAIHKEQSLGRRH